MDSQHNGVEGMVNTTLLGGGTSTIAGHRSNGQQSLVMHFGKAVLSDNIEGFRQIGMGIDGILGVRSGSKTTTMFIDFADSDITPGRMVELSNELFRIAEGQHVTAVPRSTGMAIHSDAPVHSS
jgi:hypothetical protein